MNNLVILSFLFTFFLGFVYSRATEGYSRSSPSLKREVSDDLDDYFDDDYFESDEDEANGDDEENDEDGRERRSVKSGKKHRLFIPDFAKKDNKKTTSSWSLDTGVIPDSLKGGNKNDGLLGVPGGPQAPSLGGSTPVPWRQVFNSDPITDSSNADPNESPVFSDNQGDSSFGNTDDQGASSFGDSNPGDSSFGNTDDQGASSFGDSNPGDSSFGNTDDQGASSFGDSNQGDSSFGNTDDQGASPDSNQGDASFGNTDQGGSFGDTEQNGGDNDNGNGQAGLPCTCMSILQCGATFRSTDLSESGENPCEHDGEVCCEITNPPPTPESPPATSHLECGQNHPLPDIKAGFLTETNALFGEAPWTVLVSSKIVDEENNGLWTYRCGGSLIHPRVVLTAAHCVQKQSLDNLIIRAGDWDLGREDLEPLPFQERTIESITLHPLFRSNYPPNDIALLLLTQPFDMADNVNTICIPSGHDDIDESQCVATGWGKDPKRTRQEVMKKIVMPIVPRADCQRALRQTRLGKYFKLDKSFMCAGGELGKDVCEGDGGGPLTCPLKNSGSMIQVGVTSWGVDCGKLGVPGVFTDVIKLNEWVHQTTDLLVKA